MCFRMRRMLLCALCMGVIVWVPVNQAYGFHEGANLICSDCHTMHDTDGQGTDSNSLDSHLLKSAGDALCLSCHDESQAQAPYNTNSTPKVMNAAIDLAAGDFANTIGESGSNTGKGHNLGDGLTPAGGSGTVDLHCTSCHDPHGNSNYRNLQTEVNGVTSIVVVGKEDNDWERTNSPTDHNLYNSGMVTFCGACHTNFHGLSNTQSAGEWVRHPQDETGIPASSILTGTYDPLYPVEDTAASASDTYQVGPNSEVFCLSCHRAHASEHANMGRWDFTVASGTDTACNACHDK